MPGVGSLDLARPARLLFLALLGLACLSVAAPRAARAATTTHVSQRYEIVATLDFAASRLDAVEKLTVTNRSPRAIDHVNLSVLPRALGYLAMDRPVTVDGKTVSTEWTTGTNLRVPLGRAVPRGETAVLVIPFVLTVGASPETWGARLSRDQGVMSFGMWFPILSREHDSYGLGDPQISFTADVIRMELTTAEPLGRDAVACPGLLSAPEATGTAWVCEAENVRDFAFVVNPRFRLTAGSAGETQVRVYTETVAGDLTADTAVAALETLGDAYGAYPWPDLVLAEVGAGGGFSMEYPRMIHLTRAKVTDAYVINHEVAHQWFYGQLGNHQMREPWVDEAFADFSARYVMGITEDHCSSRPVASPVFAWPAEAITGGYWSSCDGYFHAVFYQGTEFLSAVRDAMGETTFFAALREHLASHRYGETTTRALLDDLEASTSADLRPIYVAYLTTYAKLGADGVAPGRAKTPVLRR